MDINVSLPLTIKNEIDEIYKNYIKDNKTIDQYFQYITKEYVIKKDNRGLLIYYSVGYGKTILAVSVAEYYRKYQNKRKIIVLLPKSLQSNFESGVKKYTKNDNLDDYNFIGLNFNFDDGFYC